MMNLNHLKNLFSVLLMIIWVTLSCNQGRTQMGNQAVQSSSGSDTASIVFRQYEHNFGRIEEGEKVGCVFTFDNRGTAPLVISSAVTSCGCTVPKYDTRPIPPGGSGTLEVVFDSSGRNGQQTKTITVKSNATKPVVLLRITGEVINKSNNN